MWFQDFQDGCHDGHLGYLNGTILAILNLHAAPMPSTKFPLHPTYCLGADNNWRLTRWWRRCYSKFFKKADNLMPPIKFWLNQTYGLKGDVIWRWWPSWISERKDFSNSWCFPSSLSSIQLAVWEETSFEEFQDGVHLGYRNGTTLAILNLYVAPISPIKFWVNPTYSLRGVVI